MTVSPGQNEWDFAGREELEQLLERYGLEKDDICLVGSISLSVRALREHDDLDICIHSDKRSQIDPEAFDGFVAFVEERYENIELSDDELIEDDTYHDVVDGFKVVRPEISFSYKKLRDLPKDERDIEILEQYSQNTDDWNWDLYRSDYSQRPNSLLSRGLQSLRTDGVLVTADKMVGLLTRKFPIINRAVGILPVFDVRTPYSTLRGRQRTLTAAQLLNRQYVGDRFAGLDVVAYWAALEAQETGEAPGFDIEKLETDTDALSQHDPNTLEPLRLNQRHRILEPDQLARLLFDGRETIEVTFSFGRRSGGNKQWLRRQGFTDDEIETIAERRFELLDSTGVLFYAIFWPLTHEYYDEMEALLGEKVSIVDSADVVVNDIETFVHDIYDAQTDHAPGWAIDWKAELMTEFPSTVRIVKIELPNPRLHDGISREMEMVKNDVRHAFMDEFPDEYYLSILHATDSFEDNLKARAVIKSHS